MYREIALGPGSIEIRAGDFRILRTTLPPRHRIARHTHRAHNLAYTVTGGLRESFDRERLLCRPGDVVLKPADVPHDDLFAETPTTTLQLEWYPDAERSSSQSFERVLQFRGHPITALAARLHGELRIRDAAMPLIAEGLALQLVGWIARSRETWRESEVPPWLSRVRERIQEEPGIGFTIRELAAEAGVSADYLARRFRQAYGASVGQYLRRIRLELAATRLTRSRQRLSEIALDAGFADQAHFTREFKRVFGIPPGAYRRAMTAGGKAPPA